MTGLHPWVALCDRAMCSPDFDVVRGMDETEAVAWLVVRLARHGHSVEAHNVVDAYRRWPPPSHDNAQTVRFG